MFYFTVTVHTYVEKDIILFNNNLNSAEELKDSYLLILRFNAINKSTVTETYTVSDCKFLMSIQVQLKFFGHGKLTHLHGKFPKVNGHQLFP